MAAEHTPSGLDALLQRVGNYGLKGRLLAEQVGPWPRRLIGLGTILFGAAIPLLLLGAGVGQAGQALLVAGFLCAIVGFPLIVIVRAVITVRAIRDAPEDD